MVRTNGGYAGGTAILSQEPWIGTGFTPACEWPRVAVPNLLPVGEI